MGDQIRWRGAYHSLLPFLDCIVIVDWIIIDCSVIEWNEQVIYLLFEDLVRIRQLNLLVLGVVSQTMNSQTRNRHGTGMTF